MAPISKDDYICCCKDYVSVKVWDWVDVIMIEEQCNWCCGYGSSFKRWLGMS
ncbi:putative ustilagic acid hydroxylase [Sesbania bispinosa]|nr:putative ustilagic acid hydroxylase [Sesbania bispinosa]